MSQPNRDLSRHLIKFDGMIHDEALFLAIKANDLELTRQKLEGGSKVFAFNDHGHPVVVGATTEEMFRLLLEFGLDINSPILNGNTTLLHQARTPEEVRLLVSLGADLNAVDDLGDAPICKSLYPPNMDILKAFVDLGADINFQEVDRLQTLLHSAINGFDFSMGKELVWLGIDVNLLDREGDSALGYLAAFYNEKHIDVVKYFELAELITARTKDVSLTHRPDRLTPLHWACCNNSGRLVTMLLQAGADHRLRSSDGETPLELSRRMNSSEAIKSFEAFGIDN